ncbi:Vps53-like protein [Panaeolus papilionaceus]|nr:Vps53-like protein [Panaeolus papilionaceus]
MHSDELPHEVILSIQRVLEVEPTANADRLDGLSESFNAVEILNDFFPDEVSLTHIDDINAQLAETQQELQKEIDELQAELRVSQDPDRMSIIQEMISDLLGQMSRIREKATESEAVVRNITKDIQVLDLAKKNLITSMTMMKRLQMLVNAITQLEDHIKEKKYGEVTQTLSAVKQISGSFKSYTTVPSIARVWKRIQEIQTQLKSQLDGDFDAFYLQENKSIQSSQIADACHVVDVLGPDARMQVVDRFVALELKEYRRIFRTNDEAGQLDNLSRRFAWFRRLLTNHELEQGRVFPAEWRVGWHLLAKFAEITRDDVTTLLTKAGSNLTVKVLLDNLALTTEFELSMAKKWATPFKELLKATDKQHSEPGKPISAAFEPRMGIFVDAQDKVLADMLAPHRKNKVTGIKNQAPAQPRSSGEGSVTESDTDSATPVLPSSTDLFYFYGQSLEQCAKLSTGQPLFDLCTLHKKWLRIYAEEVLVVVPKRPGAGLARKSTESRVDVDLLKQLCLHINTADYCQTTALELEEKVKQKINVEFKEKITFQVECDLFISAISTSINVILREFESACDPFFATLARTSWSTVNQVSGPSPYAVELVKAAEQVVEVIKPLIEQKKYLKNFFDKASSVILVKFTNSLVRSRPLKEIGAEQLLIDMQTIKAYLTKMPGEALTSTSYSRSLSKTTMRLEALLKVIVTPVDPPEGFILNYTLLIGDASFTNFQKILDLKGTPKSAQNNLLDSFLTITSTKTDLESTSFLSSLDMDPAAGHAGGSLISPGASRVTLPMGGINEGIFASLAGPGLTGPSTGSSGTDSAKEGRREVFSDFRRLVSFGLRKETSSGS